MQITHKFLDEFIGLMDPSVRLTAKKHFWQSESALKPLVDLLRGAEDKGIDLKWAPVEAEINKIPADKKTKYSAALDFLRSKQPDWDKFHNRVTGFAKFPVADFQRQVTIPGRSDNLLIIGEGMTPGDMDEIIGNLRKLLPAIHQLANNEKLGERRNWFAQGSLPEVATALTNLDKYLNQRCSRMTFKRLHVGMRCDSDVNDPDDLVTSGLAGQVVPTVMLKGEDRPDFRKPGAYIKVPSGMKIFIGPLYFSVRNNYDAILSSPAIYRLMTLAHELTHKVIKTSDKVYELPNCRAIKDSPDGVMCADSWGYFLTEYLLSVEGTMRGGAAARRAAMGYDD